MIAGKFAEGNFLKLAKDDLERRSKDYGSYVIEALETGVPFQLNGNACEQWMLCLHHHQLNFQVLWRIIPIKSNIVPLLYMSPLVTVVVN